MQVFTFLAKRSTQLLKATSTLCRGLVAFVFLGLFVPPYLHAGVWVPISKDGIHDPKGPGAKQLQQPREALSKLEPDTAGNQVRWVKALEKGEIAPREKLFDKTVIRKLDLDVILDVKGGMPAVRFPHRQHTEWLDCVNCHEGVFKSKVGESKISMFKILQGEQCGICHGAVAFPLTECMRCHSIAKQPMVKDAPATFNPLTHQETGGRP